MFWLELDNSKCVFYNTKGNRVVVMSASKSKCQKIKAPALCKQNAGGRLNTNTRSKTYYKSFFFRMVRLF